jgi:hypothetical protein
MNGLFYDIHSRTVTEFTEESQSYTEFKTH